ncbi:DNA/RNA non-specific endonuclease [Methylomonas sp. UP202]|uniref:DNA/RNA non-specific endonuclease n=1 Tax=Methylomonas sp. UP202 TaxID=3040943 RepID=UPI00247B0496|nr:DNA/RNA non-specific endonuclease [Methylomonas sp. UP202]WGS88696.1 DNA/RNA non-specific endonuclease [Methylomonas sp. UP202]
MTDRLTAHALLLLVIFAALPMSGNAHPGKVNIEGCHTERKTGEYHCHPERAKPATAPAPAVSEPILSPSASSLAESSAVSPTEAPTIAGDRMKLDYQGFTVWLDCSQRGPVRFEYIASKDSGDLPRAKDFSLDPAVPKECQQFSAAAYGHGYDRGHQVPANHLDGSEEALRQSNYMTNILPQVAQMNRGAWERTEEIIECYRDLEDLHVIGGVIWGNNPADDYFLRSHGVKTPDAFWKVVIRGTGQDQRAIAWVVPNSPSATKSNLDRYLISVGNLEQLIGETLPVAAYAKHDKPAASWHIPHGCNKG